MLDSDALFSYLVISLKENDLSLFRRYYHNLSTEDRSQAANQIHHPINPLGVYYDGHTPLMYAIVFNRCKFLEYLLQVCGSDPEISSRFGSSKTPWNAANLALARGYFTAFNCCLQYANPMTLLRQHRNIEHASIHVLTRVLSTNIGTRVLSSDALTAVATILRHSHSRDVLTFLVRITKLPNISRENLFRIKQLHQSLISQATISPLSSPHLIADQAPSQKNQLMQLPSIPSSPLLAKPRALTESALKELQPSAAIKHEQKSRTQSLDLIPKQPSASSYFRRSAQILPAVSTQTFMRLFQAKFMRHYLDALLAQDIKNFADCGETVYTSIKDSIEKCGGISATIADSVMSVVSASKHASISATVRKAAKLLIMAEGPSGLNENAVYEQADATADSNSMAPSMTCVVQQDDPLDSVKMNRSKQARMNHISARLATRILQSQPGLASLSFDAMQHRIAVMINKIFKFINSDRFNPMVAGFTNEIAAIAEQLYQGYLEPIDERNQASKLMAERNEKQKLRVHGYFFYDLLDNQMRYFVPKKVLSKKNKLVSHFLPLPESFDLKQYPEVTSQQVIVLSKRLVFSHILKHLATYSPFSQHQPGTGQKTLLENAIMELLNEEFTPALFYPEKNHEPRRHLVHCITQQLRQYAYVVSKARKLCHLSLFQKKRFLVSKVYFSLDRPCHENNPSLLSFKEATCIDLCTMPTLKPFSIPALQAPAKGKKMVKTSRLTFPSLAQVCPYQPRLSPPPPLLEAPSPTRATTPLLLIR